jgi:hypothetical protein
MIITRLEREGERPVVVKRADLAGAERLQREAERLARASHPGVVQVLHGGAVVDGWELRTAHAGRPLSSADRGGVREVAGVVASAATTLADLHQLGLVHGRIDASHVLIGDHGRAVLCGFGDGSVAARAEDDVAALGTLLGQLLEVEDDAEPIPDRRWRRSRAWSGWERRALLLIADQATAEPPTRRPSARRLAAAIVEAVPELGPGAQPARRPAEALDLDPMASLRAGVLVEPRDVRSRSTRWLAAVAAVLLGTAVVWLPTGPPGSSPVTAPATVMTEAGSPTTEAAGLRTAATLPGSVLSAGGHRYRLGQPGDEVLVADWDCDGTSTPALLRPRTGEVYVFPRWAEDTRLAVEPVLTVPGAMDLVSEGIGDGCAALSVRLRAGDLVPVIEAAP